MAYVTIFYVVFTPEYAPLPTQEETRRRTKSVNYFKSTAFSLLLTRDAWYWGVFYTGVGICHGASALGVFFVGIINQCGYSWRTETSPCLKTAPPRR